MLSPCLHVKSFYIHNDLTTRYIEDLKAERSPVMTKSVGENLECRSPPILNRSGCERLPGLIRGPQVQIPAIGIGHGFCQTPSLPLPCPVRPLQPLPCLPHHTQQAALGSCKTKRCQDWVPGPCSLGIIKEGCLGCTTSTRNAISMHRTSCETAQRSRNTPKYELCSVTP